MKNGKREWSGRTERTASTALASRDDVLLHERALGLHDQFVGDAVDAAPRKIVARVAGEHRAIQFQRILARRLDQRALRESEPCGVQHPLLAHVLGGIRLCDRRGGGRQAPRRRPSGSTVPRSRFPSRPVRRG